MKIGEKIARFRTDLNLSQEELAEKIDVSRQSISKWEMNQALPQIDKVLMLCKLFNISADALLRDEMEPRCRSVQEKSKNKYFGTDGFRGEANEGLTSEQAYKVGRFLGWYYSSRMADKAAARARIVIGKDTRRSSYMLEYSIVAGITASGADAYMLHVTTTPSVSYVTRQDGFDCGIMITASHNPYYDNGIKVINRYVGYLISLASNSYKKLKIGLDCANGASWMIARSVFGALGAQMTVIGDTPDGLNINRECGSTHIERLCALVKEKHLDLGFAFDGDCDRCIAVSGDGRVVDGDAILYILAKRLKARGMLNGNTVVATVMSNSGFVDSLKEAGIRCEQTTVGDRFVYECMQNKGFSLGGEQSGHIILKKYATTGDGVLTAIMICEEVCDSKKSLSELSDPIRLYPQYTRNVRVKCKEDVLVDLGVLVEMRQIEDLIAGRGRILLRPSGTEPVVRVMVECESMERCADYADRMVNAILKGGHGVE